MSCGNMRQRGAADGQAIMPTSKPARNFARDIVAVAQRSE